MSTIVFSVCRKSSDVNGAANKLKEQNQESIWLTAENNDDRIVENKSKSICEVSLSSTSPQARTCILLDIAIVRWRGYNMFSIRVTGYTIISAGLPVPVCRPASGDYQTTLQHLPSRLDYQKLIGNPLKAQTNQVILHNPHVVASMGSQVDSAAAAAAGSLT